MKRRIVASNDQTAPALRHIFRYKRGLEIGEVIRMEERRSDHYGNHPITVRWPDGSIERTMSFWVRWIAKDVDMDRIFDLVNMFNNNHVDISDPESIREFLLEEYAMDWEEAEEHAEEYAKYGKQLTTQQFVHVRN